MVLVQADEETTNHDTAQAAAVESRGLTKIFHRLLVVHDS